MRERVEIGHWGWQGVGAALAIAPNEPGDPVGFAAVVHQRRDDGFSIADGNGIERGNVSEQLLCMERCEVPSREYVASVSTLAQDGGQPRELASSGGKRHREPHDGRREPEHLSHGGVESIGSVEAHQLRVVSDRVKRSR
jgi:hypothetical protein